MRSTVSALSACITGTRSLEAAEQEPIQDAQDTVSANHKMIGVAITWDAEQIFFLPASSGAARQKSTSFTSCTAMASGPTDASLQALVYHATEMKTPSIGKTEIGSIIAESWSLLGGMLGNPGPEKLTHDWKGQLAALSGSCCDTGGSALPALLCLQPVLDIRIAAWLIKPDSRDASDNPNGPAVRNPRPLSCECLMHWFHVGRQCRPPQHKINGIAHLCSETTQ